MVKEKESTKESVGFILFLAVWVLSQRKSSRNKLRKYVDRGLHIALIQFFLYPDKVIMFKDFIISGQ